MKLYGITLWFKAGDMEFYAVMANDEIEAKQKLEDELDKQKVNSQTKSLYHYAQYVDVMAAADHGFRNGEVMLITQYEN